MSRIQALLALIIFTTTSLAIHSAWAQTPAQPDPALRPTLESAFNAWTQAIASGDLKRWEAATAYSRQIEIRNRIVSQKLPFPKALFEDPVGAPSLNGLISLGVLSTGTTATSTYFGKANFGTAPGVAVRDNLLVLHFLKEDGKWKFDNLRIVRIGDNTELLLQIRNSDFSFLTGDEFQPAPQLPPVPQPVNSPDFMAEAWVDSTGYQVTIEVNGIANGTFENVRTSSLLMGGVRNGPNQIKITTSPLAGATEGAPKVEVAIYAAKEAGAPANRVFHYKPGDQIDPTVSQSFTVPE